MAQAVSEAVNRGEHSPVQKRKLGDRPGNAQVVGQAADRDIDRAVVFIGHQHARRIHELSRRAHPAQYSREDMRRHALSHWCCSVHNLWGRRAQQ